MRFTRSLTSALILVAASTTLATAQESKGATFVGKVYADTSMKRIPGVEVTLPLLAKSVISDAKGAFRMSDIPAGTHVVRARAVGFVPFEARVEFRDGKVVERGIVLPRLTLLDSVRVVGEVYVPISFLENRARGFGHFVTRDELEKAGNRALGDVVAQMPGLAVLRGRSGEGFLLSKRAPVSLNSQTGMTKKKNVVGTDL